MPRAQARCRFRVMRIHVYTTQHLYRTHVLHGSVRVSDLHALIFAFGARSLREILQWVRLQQTGSSRHLVEVLRYVAARAEQQMHNTRTMYHCTEQEFEESIYSFEGSRLKKRDSNLGPSASEKLCAHTSIPRFCTWTRRLVRYNLYRPCAKSCRDHYLVSL